MKNRTALRDYFLTNKIPKQEDFHELIDSSLNQEEDGIRRAVNGPIELEARGAGELLNLYKSFSEGVALWKISHKPARAGEPATAGLDIADGQASRLFIRTGDGNVGIGTAVPASRLQVVSADNEVATNVFDVQAQNLTQGVGLWWGGIRKTGTNPAGDLALDAKGNGAILLNTKGGTGNVGIGTAAAPATTLDVRTEDKSAAITVGTRGASGGAVYLGNPNHGLRRGFPEINSNNHVGLYTTSGDLYLSGNGPSTAQFVLTNGGNVGIGTSAPDTKLHVDGAVKINGRNVLEFGGGVPGKEVNAGKIGYGTFDGGASLNIVGAGTDGNNRKIQFWNEGGATFNGNIRATGSMGVDAGNANNGTAPVGSTPANTLSFGGTNTGEAIGSNRTSGSNPSGLDFYTCYVKRLCIANNGNVGIGTDAPRGQFDVAGLGDIYLVKSPNVGTNQSLFLPGHTYLAPYDGSNLTYLQARRADNSGTVALRLRTYNNGALTEALHIEGNGNVGIGTTNPQYPLHITKVGGPGLQNYRYYNINGPGGTSSGQTDVSIYATARVVGAEFNAISDARLKTVVGRSDHAADLALLRRLRITDYTMRDRVQFGDQPFKKIIAQELEEVFPQAVHQHTGFLPDIYAPASQVQRQGEALLIGLPTGLPEAATAGQRLKLIGPVGEVLATLAEAAEAGSRQLLVTGGDSLADAPAEVFVFGLEHANVRTVDYEAVAMLNVSATQELARQVQDLHQQNAALNELNRAQSTKLSEVQTALHALQQQVATLLGEPGILQRT